MRDPDRLELVQSLLKEGKSWGEIGFRLGLTRQAAQQWYSRQVSKPLKVTISAISKYLDVTRKKVEDLIDELQLSIRDPDLIKKLSAALEAQKCLYCGQVLPRDRFKFCTNECRDVYHKRRGEC